MSARDADPSHDTDAAPSTFVRWIAGSVITAALVIGVALYYRTEVCEEQLTESGQIVTLCRSLRAVDPPLIGIGIIVIVALMAFFTEVSGFGISLKREVRRAAKKAKEAAAKADDATSTAHSAQQTSQVAEEVARASAYWSRSTPQVSEVSDEINELIVRYNETRADERPGSERTARMTTIVSKMISNLSGVDRDAIDLDGYIEARDDHGRRLTAYSYLYANPDPRLASTLVRALLAEPTRFGQYWAIRALRRLISVDPSALDLNSRRDLERFLSRLGHNTDRAFELRQVLAAAPTK